MRRAIVTLARVDVLDHDEPLAFVERQRRIDDRVDDPERDGTDRDGDRHAGDADDREPRILDEHPQAEPEVERHAREPRDAAVAAHLFLVPLDAAEGDERLASRFDRIQPALPDETVRFHVDVETKLLLHARFRALSAGHQAQARADPGEPAHVVRSTASSPAENRRQFSSSTPSARFPAGVMR
jgi:hypothetical protein